MTYEELREKYGETYQRWSIGTEIRPGDTGETRVEVAERMVRGIHRYLPKIENGQTLVVATHGGAARAAVAKLLGMPHNLWGSLGILANCSWVVLQEVPGLDLNWRLIEYNAGSLPLPALSDDR
jgi:probable phosphoglycerate mutase